MTRHAPWDPGGFMPAQPMTTPDGRPLVRLKVGGLHVQEADSTLRPWRSPAEEWLKTFGPRGGGPR